MWEWEVEGLVSWNGLFCSFQNAYGIHVTIGILSQYKHHMVVVVVELVGYIIIILKRNTSFPKKQVRIELKKILMFQNEHLDKKFEMWILQLENSNPNRSFRFFFQ